MNPSSVVRWLEGLHGPLPYAVLLLVAFAEHALLIGTLVPGEVILPLAGVVAATTGGLAWLPAALCATAGGFLADQLAFWLARSWTIRRGGWVAGGTGGRFARSAAIVRELYRRHGVWTLILGRFVAGAAPFVAPAAGWAGMAYRRFLPANALANLVWGPVMIGVGYLFGAQAARLQGPWRWGGIALTAAVLGLAFLRLRAIGSELARSAGTATWTGQDRRRP
ncbi:MAG TPA: DedA family protein [Actinomycetota bacterium]|nr:DedA family protein [Actinomycetota bacterium]